MLWKLSQKRALIQWPYHPSSDTIHRYRTAHPVNADRQLYFNRKVMTFEEKEKT